MISFVGASPELPGSWWCPISGGPFGAAPPVHSSVPAGGCCGSTYFPKGLICSEPLAAASPGPRWGASIPSTTAQQLVPGQPGRGASSPSVWGLAQAGLMPVGLPGSRVGPRRPLCTGVCLCVSACTGVCASIVGKRGRGHFAFCKIIS